MVGDISPLRRQRRREGQARRWGKSVAQACTYCPPNDLRVSPRPLRSEMRRTASRAYQPAPDCHAAIRRSPSERPSPTTAGPLASVGSLCLRVKSSADQRGDDELDESPHKADDDQPR